MSFGLELFWIVPLRYMYIHCSPCKQVSSHNKIQYWLHHRLAVNISPWIMHTHARMHKKTGICYHSFLALPPSMHTLKFFISAENPMLWTFFLSSLAWVCQNIVLHASSTTRKNDIFLVAINFSFCNFIPIFDTCDFLSGHDLHSWLNIKN